MCKNKLLSKSPKECGTARELQYHSPSRAALPCQRASAAVQGLQKLVVLWHSGCTQKSSFMVCP